MGSTRLHGKVMMPINGRPLIDYMIERLKHSEFLEQIVFATTDAQMDKPIVDWCKQSTVACFQGDEDDVLIESSESRSFTTIQRDLVYI